MFVSLFFFFQAEDGIRDLYVTGVQTCALPISADKLRVGDRVVVPFPIACGACAACAAELYSCCENTNPNARSEERRVGKECRARGAAGRLKKNRESTAMCD